MRRDVLALLAATVVLGWLAATAQAGPLVSYWPFDGTAADEVGGRHGTEHGSPTYATDPTRGTVLSLAPGDYIDFGDGAPDGAGAMSLTFWFHTDYEFQSNGDLIVKYGSSPSNSGPFRIRHLDFDTFHICLGTETLPTCRMMSERAFFDNWVFMVMTYDQATGIWYNGHWVLNAHGSATGQGVTGNLVDTTAPLQVGVNWAGEIDDLALWSQALDPAHIERLSKGEPVPEPTTLSLLLTAGLLLLSRRRR